MCCSPLDSYFNRERVSLEEIHGKYGHNGQVRHVDTLSWLKQLFFTRCNIDTLDTWIDTGWRERFSQVCEDDCYLHGSRGPRNKNQVVVLYALNAELSDDLSKLENKS